MDLTALREALRREPFEVFAIRLTDGRVEQVKHPEFVAIAPRIVVVVRDDNSWSVVDPRSIVSLDYEGRRGPKRRGDGNRGDEG